MKRASLTRRLRRRCSSSWRSPAPPRSRSPRTSSRRCARAIEQRYDVVPLAVGVALTPKSPRGDVRLVEISDTIAINGVAVAVADCGIGSARTRTRFSGSRIWAATTCGSSLPASRRRTRNRNSSGRRK